MHCLLQYQLLAWVNAHRQFDKLGLLLRLSRDWLLSLRRKISEIGVSIWVKMVSVAIAKLFLGTKLSNPAVIMLSFTLHQFLCFNYNELLCDNAPLPQKPNKISIKIWHIKAVLLPDSHTHIYPPLSSWQLVWAFPRISLTCHSYFYFLFASPITNLNTNYPIILIMNRNNSALTVLLRNR